MLGLDEYMHISILSDSIWGFGAGLPEAGWLVRDSRSGQHFVHPRGVLRMMHCVEQYVESHMSCVSQVSNPNFLFHPLRVDISRKAADAIRISDVDFIGGMSSIDFLKN